MMGRTAGKSGMGWFSALMDSLDEDSSSSLSVVNELLVVINVLLANFLNCPSTDF